MSDESALFCRCNDCLDPQVGIWDLKRVEMRQTANQI